MSDFFSDPRYLAPLATTVGVTVTITLWMLNLRRKELSFEILSDTPLITLKEEVKDKVEISFHGQPVHDVHLVQVRITNSGNVPIRSADYEGRLSIAVPEGSRILMAEVVETHPQQLEKRVRSEANGGSLIEETEDNAVVIRPILMNNRDWLTVKMLVTNPAGKINVSGHIEGIHEIRRTKESTVMPLVMANIGTFIMVISLFFLDPTSLSTNDWGEYLPYLVFFLIGYLMLMVGIYFPRLHRTT